MEENREDDVSRETFRNRSVLLSPSEYYSRPNTLAFIRHRLCDPAEDAVDHRLPMRLFATDRFSRLSPVETMAVAVEGVVEEAVDTTVEAVVFVEAMVEDVSMDTMVVVGGGGCRIFIHKTLNMRPHP
ncbi:hypothetical protein F2Q69_00014010 [Brassica cretica]|uniref:Uncharacterized protein n=1 Tax=Brassica cretica TaxID=69181 RepID=A0A8S9R1V2_BRACR|nr:hypothetical protein F2Q69_00014010 [Brassica cretica]